MHIFGIECLILPFFVFFILLWYLWKCKKNFCYFYPFCFVLICFMGFFFSPFLRYFNTDMVNVNAWYFVPEFFSLELSYSFACILLFLFGFGQIKEQFNYDEKIQEVKEVVFRIQENKFILFLFCFLSFIFLLINQYDIGSIGALWMSESVRGTHAGVGQFDRKDAFFLNILLTFHAILGLFLPLISSLLLIVVRKVFLIYLLPFFISNCAFGLIGQSRLCGLFLFYLVFFAAFFKGRKTLIYTWPLIILFPYICFACYFMRAYYNRIGLYYFFICLRDFWENISDLPLAAYNMLDMFSTSSFAYYVQECEYKGNALENVFILFQYLNPLPGFGRKYELGVNNLTEYVGIFSYGIPTPCIPQTYIAFGWYGVILWFVIGKLVKYIVLSVVKYTSMLVIVSSFLCVISFGISIHSPLRQFFRIFSIPLFICIYFNIKNNRKVQIEDIANQCNG